jgi:hypothetical protein
LGGKTKKLAEGQPIASGQQAGDFAVGVEDVETQDFASLRGVGEVGGDAADLVIVGVRLLLVGVGAVDSGGEVFGHGAQIIRTEQFTNNCELSLRKMGKWLDMSI